MISWKSLQLLSNFFQWKSPDLGWPQIVGTYLIKTDSFWVPRPREAGEGGSCLTLTAAGCCLPASVASFVFPSDFRSFTSPFFDGLFGTWEEGCSLYYRKNSKRQLSRFFPSGSKRILHVLCLSLCDSRHSSWPVPMSHSALNWACWSPTASLDRRLAFDGQVTQPRVCHLKNDKEIKCLFIWRL